MNKQITLYIGGTKQRQAGFADLAIIGVFPVGEFKNMDRATLIAEKPVWSIKHTSDYILYQLIDRRVKSFDADANGVLSIAITIPNDMQLADCKSPYSLLKTVYDKFRNEYMSPYSDGRDTFLDIKTENEGFQEIISQYSLEPRKGRYVVMNGTLTGTLCVPQNKMEDLFRDSQYAEFANYKDIEIGSNCPTTMGLELLEIPRPVSYEIYVKGIRQPESLSKLSDAYITRLNDTEDYKYQNISFTLGDLMASENGIYTQGASSVKLDKENRRILCDVQRVEIRYKGTLRFIGKQGNKDIVKRAIENGEIRINFGSSNLMDYQTSGLEFELPAKLLRNTSFSITPNKTRQGFILSVIPSIEQELQSITIEVTIREEEKKVVPSSVPVTHSGNKNGNKSSGYNKQFDNQKDQEEDPNLIEERKRKESEKRKKLLIIGFVVGFVSALVLSGLGFGVYLMLKGKDTEKDDKLYTALNDVKRLKNDSTEFVNKISKLELDKINLKEQIAELQQHAEQYAVQKKKKEADEKADAKDKARADILELVKQKKLNDCRTHNGWKKYLTQDERLGVEAILNPREHEKVKKMTDKKRLEKLLKELEINNWDDIIKARNEIMSLQSTK